MRPLRYSINVTLDGGCDHRAIDADEEMHRQAIENLALADALLLGRIDEYEFVVHARIAGHGPTLFAGSSKRIDLKLVSRKEFRSGAVALRYEPVR